MAKVTTRRTLLLFVAFIGMALVESGCARTNEPSVQVTAVQGNLEQVMLGIMYPAVTDD